MVRTTTALVALFIFLAGGSSVFADDTFAGCFFDTGSTVTQTDPAVSGATNADECTVACGSEWDFSYFRVTDQSCVCANDFPPSSCMSQGNTNTCSEYDFEARIITTSFSNSGCYSSVEYASMDQGAMEVVAVSPEQCFDQCKDSYDAVWYTGFDDYSCKCATRGLASEGALETCDENEFMVFTHPPEAAASSLVRRRLRDQLTLALLKSSKLCPRSLKACRLTDDLAFDAYECIDTSSELESCGGCLHGEYGVSPNGTASGQDCSKLGASMGGVTCSSGVCLISSCHEGSSLLSGACVVD
ncbi:hypothetical protein IAR55_003097 [Kwoniella newhampshirensis]|uniref:Protein CPL1-like domain-containing protein n=1 Tax=Kwoniella newhampshirensis TaxID=1651941 RepID=A0AAW0YPR7_9TREE